MVTLPKADTSRKVPAFAKQELIKKKAAFKAAIDTLQKDSTRKEQIYNRMEGPIFFGEHVFSTRQEYDSLQKALPADKKDGWFKRNIIYRNIDLTGRFRDNQTEVLNGLLESFEHHFPQTLFISLPLFALVLQLLYVRHKNLYYANHIIYTVHLYCALFVFLFIILMLERLKDLHYLSWLQWIQFAVMLYAAYYTYKALRVFYAQSRLKTIIKWLLLNTAAIVIMIVLFMSLFAVTVFLL